MGVLDNLYQPAYSPDAWHDFWFMNWIDHQDIHTAIQAQTPTKINSPLYVITPWTWDSPNALLLLHQQYHNDMNGILGLSGEDLSLIDWKDKEAVNDWTYQHFQEHLAAHEELGI